MNTTRNADLTIVRDRLEVVTDAPAPAAPTAGATWAHHTVPTTLGVMEVAADRVDLAWALASV